MNRFVAICLACLCTAVVVAVKEITSVGSHGDGSYEVDGKRYADLDALCNEHTASASPVTFP